ncbi:hypothetical protein M0R45_023722 [Rubus argutus]|uniref:Ubiquitin-like domain-containing protein n=1 Tax=Rubus argutus TaxID=59490 RepID=A0AAW1WR24_RUBAR
MDPPMNFSSVRVFTLDELKFIFRIVYILPEHCDQGSLGRRRLPPADPSFGNNYASEITDFATTGYNRNPRGSARAVLGKRDGGLSDEMTLEYYGISHGTVLTVLQKIRVTIRIANNHFLGLIVNEDITVGTLKDYLRDQHGMDDIENKALEMEYEGKLVALDDRTYLWAAGIEEGTALSLVRA